MQEGTLKGSFFFLLINEKHNLSVAYLYNKNIKKRKEENNEYLCKL